MQIENTVITELDINQPVLKVPAFVSGITAEALSCYVGDRIEKISVEDGNKVFCVENNCLIDRKKSMLVLAGDNPIIPDGIEIIGDFAFHRHEELEKIVIPPSVKEIRYMAFALTGLKEAVLPEGLTELFGNAFALCDKLEKINIPKSLRKIYGTAFSGCENLKEIVIDGNENFSFDGRVLKETATGKIKADLSDLSAVKLIERLADNENPAVAQALLKARRFTQIPVLINISEDAIRPFIENIGSVRTACASGSGANKVIEAVDGIAHILNPAKKVLVIVECGLDLEIDRLTEASDRMKKYSGEAHYDFCVSIDKNITDGLKLTVLAVE